MKPVISIGNQNFESIRKNRGTELLVQIFLRKSFLRKSRGRKRLISLRRLT